MTTKQLIDSWYFKQSYDSTTPLCTIMKKFGSDKSTSHNYTTLYHQLFEKIQNNAINLLEVGLGTNNPNIDSNMGVDGKPCASLYGWREYFNKASIFGADVDKNILCQSDRIKTFFVDSLNEITIYRAFKYGYMTSIMFDIIIDDGLHTSESQKKLFFNLIDKLKPGGIYIIEDVINKDEWDEFLATIIHCVTFVKLIELPGRPGRTDNILVIIEK